MTSDQPCLPFGQTLADQFEKFHAENPKVYTVLVRLAREWKQRTGRNELGIKTLYERTRWEIALATKSPDFKLNNNFTSFYARLLMAENEDLDGMFQLRASEADTWINEHLMRAAS